MNGHDLVRRDGNNIKRNQFSFFGSPSNGWPDPVFFTLIELAGFWYRASFLKQYVCLLSKKNNHIRPVIR